ncbi:hypothetical protein WN943_010445 [Citrus x changshan-huyou]
MGNSSLKLQGAGLDSNGKGLITSKFASRSEIGWLVDKFHDLAKDVANLVFKYVPKDCNSVAHKLSKLALLKPNCCLWLKEARAELMALLSCDNRLSD